MGAQMDLMEELELVFLFARRFQGLTESIQSDGVRLNLVILQKSLEVELQCSALLVHMLDDLRLFIDSFSLR